LVNRSYVGADDLPAVARQVKSRLAAFASPIGDDISFSQPLHYGRRLVGSNHFVGRDDLLWRIHDGLSKSGAAMLTGAARSVVQLCGFGGVGKSVLAEEYALRFGAAYPGGVFWLKAYGNDAADTPMREKDRDGERLRQLSDFASQLHVPPEGAQPSVIQAALARVLASDRARRSLWIVDDLPSGLDEEAVLKWLSPHASVPTLITTRDRTHSSLGELMDVNVLSGEESFALLETHREVKDSERAAARELLDALGHHALAVEITGSFLGDQQSISIGDFLADLRDPGEDILELAAELADSLPHGHSPHIVATLESTFNQLKEPARDLLCLASFLAAAPIPKELIETVFARLGGGGSASSRRMKAAHETDRFALSRREPTPADALSVHTLVARAARRHPGSRGRLETIRAAAVAALTDLLRGMFSLGSILRQSLVITHARVMSAPLTTAEEAMLLVLVANMDLNRGDLDTAGRLARRALDYCRAELGEDSLETCHAKSGMAMVLMARGDIAGAHEILEAILPVFERSLPEGDIFRVGTQLGLALTAAAQGDAASAYRLSAAALSAAESRGADHPMTLKVKSLMAQILYAQGDLQGAGGLLREVSAARQRAVDGLDVDSLTDEFLMAQGSIGSSGIESAAPVIVKAVRVFRRQLGENNILTLNAQLLLLLLRGSRGKGRKARRLAREIVPRLEQMLGPNSPATLQARCVEALALLCDGDGDASAASSLLESVIPQLEAVLGAEHSEVFSAKVCLAQARHSDNDAEGARRLLEVLIPAAEARLGPAHAVVLNGRACLALCGDGPPPGET
jgi:tetratricopeptide (TPR) repeat protein